MPFNLTFYKNMFQKSLSLVLVPSGPEPSPGPALLIPEQNFKWIFVNLSMSFDLIAYIMMFWKSVILTISSSLAPLPGIKPKN